MSDHNAMPADLSPIYVEGIKAISEVFVKPFLKKLSSEHLQNSNYQSEESLLTSLDKYLTRLYKNVSVVNVIGSRRREVILDDIYIPLTLKNNNNKNRYIVDEYHSNLFENNSHVLIIDTAGMGKSTIVKKLISSIICKFSGIPVLIELRRLSEKIDIVDTILDQLNQINRNFDRELLVQMIDNGNFFFFFDGYDEIPLNEKSKVTFQLNNFISRASNNYFIVTSRPESSLSSFGSFAEYSIQGLGHEQAYTLLRKYDNDGIISNNLIKKIREPNIMKYIQEYLKTPLLVSLLFNSFEYKENIPEKKHIFYRQVYDSLFESHDLSKGDSFIRDKKSQLSIDDFHRLLRCFGFICLTQGNTIEFTKDGLVNALTEALKLSKNLNPKVSDFIYDITVAVPIMREDGMYYKWSHKSLQEYFASQYIYHDAKENLDKILLYIAFHENNGQFINTLDLFKSTDENSFKEIVVLKYLEDLKLMNDKFKSIFPNQNIGKRIYHYFTKTVIGFRSKDFYVENTSENIESNTMHEKIRNLTNCKSLAIKHIQHDDLQRIDYINFPKIPNKYHFLQPLIDSYNIFKQESTTHNDFFKDNIKLNLNITFDEVVFFAEDITSELNSVDNFDAISTIMNYYLSSIKSRTLNEKRMNDLLNEISINKSNKLLNDMLTF